jgi:hypothetical protein
MPGSRWQPGVSKWSATSPHSTTPPRVSKKKDYTASPVSTTSAAISPVNPNSPYLTEKLDLFHRLKCECLFWVDWPTQGSIWDPRPRHDDDVLGHELGACGAAHGLYSITSWAPLGTKDWRRRNPVPQEFFLYIPLAHWKTQERIHRNAFLRCIFTGNLA